MCLFNNVNDNNQSLAISLTKIVESKKEEIIQLIQDSDYLTNFETKLDNFVRTIDFCDSIEFFEGKQNEENVENKDDKFFQKVVDLFKNTANALDSNENGKVTPCDLAQLMGEAVSEKIADIKEQAPEWKQNISDFAEKAFDYLDANDSGRIMPCDFIKLFSDAVSSQIEKIKEAINPSKEEPSVTPEVPPVAPEEPPVVPEEPTVEPEEPTVAPEEPTVAPDEPPVEPEEPPVCDSERDDSVYEEESRPGLSLF